MLVNPKITLGISPRLSVPPSHASLNIEQPPTHGPRTPVRLGLIAPQNMSSQQSNCRAFLGRLQSIKELTGLRYGFDIDEDSAMRPKKKSSARLEAEKWFNLSKYDELYNFNLAQWGDQIARRHFIKHELETDRDSAVVNKEIPRLTLEPLAPWRFDLRPALHDLKLKDLIRLLKESSIQLDGTTDDLEQRASDINETIGRFGHLSIDLNARDQTLKDSFALWLDEQRQSMSKTFKPPKNIGEEAELKWARLRILPYFDLHIWSKWSNNHLTQPDIVDLLLEEVDGATRSNLREIEDNLARVITIQNACDLVARFKET